MNSTSGTVGPRRVEADYVSESPLLEGVEMLSPLMVWASRSGVTIAPSGSRWRASVGTGDLVTSVVASTPDSAAGELAGRAGIESCDAWRIRLARAGATWHYPLWQVPMCGHGPDMLVVCPSATGVPDCACRCGSCGGALCGDPTEVAPEMLIQTIARASEPERLVNALRRGARFACSLVAKARDRWEPDNRNGIGTGIDPLVANT